MIMHVIIRKLAVILRKNYACKIFIVKFAKRNKPLYQANYDFENE